MSVPFAYLGIVLIWATTPLAVQWSTQGIGFAFAALAPMVIGLVLAGLLVALWRIPLPLHERARRAYLVGGLALFGTMALTYWGARYIHSGLVSVLFGLAPLAAAAIGAIFAAEPSPTRAKLLGMLMGVAGLATIFFHGDSLGHENAPLGLLAVLGAVTVYSGSMVWLKQIGDDSPPLATTVGSLAVSLPCFALLWWATDGQLPQVALSRAVVAITYLGIFGSVIGFALYYYVIKHLDTSKVALITLMTPVIALALGAWFNGESIGFRLWMGTTLILFGLSLHQWEMLAGFRRRF